MPLKIACTAGHKLIVPSDRAGQPITCPRCNETFIAAGTPEDDHESRAGPPSMAHVDPSSSAMGEETSAPPNPWPVIRTDNAPPAHRRTERGASLLAIVTIAAAVFSAVPAVFEIASAWRSAEPPLRFAPARWALVLGWLCLLQLAYGVFLWQWNNKTSARVVAVALVGLAGAYAAALAVVLFADPHGWLAGHDGLEFADKLAGGKAALWCLCLVSLSTALAYFAARLSMHWQPAERLSRGVG